jgi:uncharacterized protein (TIGR00252 family)
MKTTTIGHQAESTVAEELKRQGFKILAQNWKTKVCEIDIVARKAGVVYFVEVKYRSRAGQGGGLEHITSAKLNRMRFAAQVWVQNYNWGGDWRLVAAAASTDGQDYLVDEIIELD